MRETIDAILRKRAQKQPENVAYIHRLNEKRDEIKITYAELDLQAKRIAHALRHCAQKPPSITLLLFPPGLDFICAFFGCLCAGVIAVPLPLPTKRTFDRVQKVLDDTRAEVILTTSQCQTLLSKDNLLSATTSLQWIAIDTIQKEGDYTRYSFNKNDIAFLQYTSGSTSRPKGVMVTHENIMANQEMIKRGFGHDENTIFAGWLPHFHDMGLIGNILQPMYLGIPSILLAPVAFMQKPFMWLQTISDHRATTSGGPNFSYELCVEKITDEQMQNFDLSSWKIAFNGAEPVNENTLCKFAKKFGGCGFRYESFYPCYGLAEATLFVSGNFPKTPPKTHQINDKKTLIGLGQEHGEEKIIIVNPESCIPCATNEEGEIWISGPNIATGYWNQVEATQETFHAKINGDEREFMRTGDLGFFNADKQLFVTGRIKDLIIIRGKNVYPQDLEASIVNCDVALRSNGCAAFSLQIDDQEQLVIVAEVGREYVRDINYEALFGKIKHILSQDHQLAAYEIILIKPSTLPKTSSGKIQRSVCRQFYKENHLEIIARSETKQVIESQNNVIDIQNELKKILKAVLKIQTEKLDHDLPLTYLGVDSLDALSLQSAIETRWNICFPYEELLECNSIGEIVRSIETKKSALPSPLNANPSHFEETPLAFPLSYQQQGIWTDLQINDNSTRYNLGKIVEIVSSINIDIFEQAIKLVQEKNDLLRTVFRSENEQPIQNVLKTIKIDFQEKQIANTQLTDFLNQEILRPFCLDHLPLFKIWLLKTDNGKQYLFLIAHHIICDLWSLGLFLEALFTNYHSLITGQEPTKEIQHIPYAKYVNWQQEYLKSEETKAAVTYWKSQLQDCHNDIKLPFDRPRPQIRTFSGEIFPIEINNGLSKKIKEFARQQNTTPYIVMLSAYAVLLSLYSGERKICVGTTSSGRQHSNWYQTFGLFANLMPCPLSLSLESTFEQQVEATNALILKSMGQHQLPFLKLLQESNVKRSSSAAPFFQTMFVYQHVPTISKEMNGLLFPSPSKINEVSFNHIQLKPYIWQPPISLFDITLFVCENSFSNFTGYVEFDANLFDQDTIELFGDQFVQMLTKCISESSFPLAELNFSSNDSKSFSHSSQNLSIHNQTVMDFFADSVRERPDHTVLMSNNAAFSYQYLDSLSNQLARLLILNGIEPHDVVALYVDHSVELVASLLAIFKIGAIFLPLDIKHPSHRILTTIEESQAKMVITKKNQISSLKIPVLDLSSKAIIDQIQHISYAPLPSIIMPENVAYLIYTSGSTGKPKGIAISHRAILHYLKTIPVDYNLNEDLHFPLYSSLAFDLTLTSLLYPLFFSHTIHLYPQDNDLIEQFHKIIHNPKITHLKLTPAHLHFLKELPLQTSNIVQLIVGGEQLTTALMGEVSKLFSHSVSIINEYGPTETTIGCIFFNSLTDKLAPLSVVPIGQPLTGTEAYVCNDYLQELPINCPGELYLGGPNLGYGYWNQPSLTAERFLPHFYNPSDRLYKTSDGAIRLKNNHLLCLGRLDRQIKVRGYRIELEEIEATILKHPKIEKVVVTAVKKQTQDTEQYLCGYFVSKSNQLMDIGEIKEYLHHHLPDYMIPKFLIQSSQIPLTANGKIDLKALPTPFENQNEDELKLPSSEKESVLFSIWAEVLQIAPHGLSINKNFFELGGDSIKAMQITARSRKLGLHFSVRELFSHPTIEDLAKNVTGQIQSTSDKVELIREKPMLSPIQEWFFKHFAPEFRNHYNQAVLLKTKEGHFNQDALKAALEAIIAHHDGLRTVFSKQRNPVSLEHPTYSFTTQKLSSLEDINYRVASLQTQLNIKTTPLINITLFQSKEVDLLAIIIHHLLIDAVSWRILLEDLDNAYQAFIEKSSVALPNKTTSYFHWVLKLLSHYTNQIDSKELTYWKNLEESASSHATKYFPIKKQCSVNLSLSEDLTNALKYKLYSSREIQIHEALLIALALTYKKIFAKEALLLHLEGHGREEFTKDIDLTRTVGWFTQLTPLYINLHHISDLPTTVQMIKKTLEELPNFGIGYSLLRMLPNFSDNWKIRGDLQPHIVLNYLGEIQSDNYTNFTFKPVLDHLCSENSTSPYNLQINAYILNKTLHCRFTFDQDSFSQEEIEKLPFIFESYLQNLVNSFQTVLPLTSTQQGLLFHAMQDPKSKAYFEQGILKFSGDIRPEDFHYSFQKLIEEHETLRATFHYDAIREPYQYIHPYMPSAFFYEKTDMIDLEKILSIDREDPFILNKGPLIRLRLINNANDQYYLIFSFHHIILDGWSFMILFTRFLDNLEAIIKKNHQILPHSTISLKRYTNWLSTQDKEKSLNYWSKLVKNFSEPTTIPRQQAIIHHAQSVIKTRKILLDDSQILKIEKFAKTHYITLNTFFQALWSIVLFNYTQQEDLIFGSVFSGRPSHLNNSEFLVGNFITTLPMCIHVDDKKGFLHLAQSIQQQIINHEEYATTPLYEIQALSLLKHKLIEHLFVFENYPFAGAVERTIKEKGLPFYVFEAEMREETHYPFSISVIPGRKTNIEIQYDSSQFHGEFIEYLLNYYNKLIDATIQNPEIAIAELKSDPMLPIYSIPQGELHSYPAKTLAQLFEDQVIKNPDKVALVMDDSQLTYQQLDQQANLFSHFLRNNGIKAEDCVAIYLQRSIDLFIAWLAVLKAGAAYVPIEASLPIEKIEMIIAEAKCKFIISNSIFSQQLPPALMSIVIDLNGNWTTSASILDRTEKENTQSSPDNLAYILYTSGSTGKPKGIAMTHASVCNHFNWIKRKFGLCSNDRMLQLTAFSFDVSLCEFYVLFVGGTLVLAPLSASKDAEIFIETIENQKITFLQLVPSFLETLLNPSLKQRLSSIRQVLCGADVLKREHIIKWFTSHNIPLTNLYGLTETCIDATYYDCQPNENNTDIPIGKPLDNFEIFILDAQLNPVPFGAIGELYLGGPGLARSYQLQADLTAERFIPHPYKSGQRIFQTRDSVVMRDQENLNFLGRKDKQVKLRGVRIELGEIEAVLSKHSDIAQLLVTLIDSNGANPFLCAYFVGKKQIEPNMLKSFAVQHLPLHLVPLHYVQLSSFPLTTSGKVDSKSLPIPSFQVEISYIAPETDFQKKLIDIWHELLKIDRDKISIDHNFFDLGGNSIKLMQMQHKFNETFDKKITVDLLFLHHTIRSQAIFLSDTPEKVQNTTSITERIAQGKKYRRERFTSKQSGNT